MERYDDSQHGMTMSWASLDDQKIQQELLDKKQLAALVTPLNHENGGRAISCALQALREHGAVHFILNTGGHWILVSAILNRDGTNSVLCLDSCNPDQVRPNTLAAQGIAYVAEMIRQN